MATKKKSKKKSGAIAITGVHSFVGRRLLQWLERETHFERIIALDKEPPRTAHDKTSFYKIDLTRPVVDADIADILKRESVDTVAHLAFLSRPSHDSAHAHELENIGTLYVLNACAAAKTRRFLLGSTTLVYGANPLNPNYLTEKHPLKTGDASRFIRDKVEAELQTRRYAQETGRLVTVLRPCSVLGPTIDNLATRFFSHRVVPTMMGYDPLVQFLHEDDLLSGFQLALLNDAPGEFNLVGKGVMALSTVLAVSGQLTLPVPYFAARSLLNLAWAAELADAPPTFLDFLRYLCVADGARAEEKLGFVPRFSTKETLLDFIRTQRLRRIRLSPGELSA